VNSRKIKSTEANGQRRRATGKRRKVVDDDASEAEGPTSVPQATVAVNSTATRAAKTNANKKLDAQAKALAEFQRQNLATTKTGRASKRRKLDEEEEFATPRRTLGTRMSKRLRQSLNDEDEWQQIPDEWLSGDDKTLQAVKKTVTAVNENSSVLHEDNPCTILSKGTSRFEAKTGLESDTESISDLTELSTTSGTAEDNEAKDDYEGTGKENETDEAVEDRDEEQQHNPVDEDFVEWELVSSTPPSRARI
jgi:hypothetical protein